LVAAPSIRLPYAKQSGHQQQLTPGLHVWLHAPAARHS
jgi:hypothetical protein